MREEEHEEWKKEKNGQGRPGDRGERRERRKEREGKEGHMVSFFVSCHSHNIHGRPHTHKHMFLTNSVALFPFLKDIKFYFPSTSSPTKVHPTSQNNDPHSHAASQAFC